jgi:predicted kinase
MYKPRLIILIGIPGSGKTTYAKEYARIHDDTIHISSDSIRHELYGDESIQGDPTTVFSLMQKRAVESIKSGKTVLYDATNMTRKDRAGIIAACPRHAQIEAHIIWAPIETCVERDANRERTVGRAVIDKMLKRFQAPYYDEGFDDIKIVRPNNFDEYAYAPKCMNEMNIPHDNPHHTLSVYEHCIEACNQIEDTQSDLYYAAMIHDVGKPYVKSFTDSKGNPCETAHYYQHQCISAWLSYGFPFATTKIAWLVSEHMSPFMNTKYYRKLPVYLKKDIDILHEADLSAR